MKETAARLIKIQPPESDAEEDIRRALKLAARLGLTGIHTSSPLKELETYRKLALSGQLTLRVYAWLPIQGIDDYISRGIKTGPGR